MYFETLKSKTKFVGRAFSVRQDKVRLPDGNTTCLDIVEHSGAGTSLPIDLDGTIWFVRQYRHAVGTHILEIPAGGLEEGETPEVCAQREIQEEIGMGAKSLKEIGSFFLAPGYSSEYLHIFLATDLYPSTLPKDEDEILSVEKIPASIAIEMVRNGQFQDAKTIASFYLGLQYFEAAWL